MDFCKCHPDVFEVIGHERWYRQKRKELEKYESRGEQGLVKELYSLRFMLTAEANETMVIRGREVERRVVEKKKGLIGVHRIWGLSPFIFFNKRIYKW